MWISPLSLVVMVAATVSQMVHSTPVLASDGGSRTETGEGVARGHHHAQQGVGATDTVDSVRITPVTPHTSSAAPAQRFDIAWNSPWPAGCPPGSVEPVPDFARYGVRMGCNPIFLSGHSPVQALAVMNCHVTSLAVLFAWSCHILWHVCIV